ncbi:hypothetical protein H5410_034991 [Solanum commersonii]|uniref:Uncharacterized protein n=1 Tax=Solanum commersonii TaxID=4109 RepID=A0A9J5Y1N1_SOLCO|nr:hypothetical protein H5410_034991 [Solanum commersonii]
MGPTELKIYPSFSLAAAAAATATATATAICAAALSGDKIFILKRQLMSGLSVGVAHVKDMS